MTGASARTTLTKRAGCGLRSAPWTGLASTSRRVTADAARSLRPSASRKIATRTKTEHGSVVPLIPVATASARTAIRGPAISTVQKNITAGARHIQAVFGRRNSTSTRTIKTGDGNGTTGLANGSAVRSVLIRRLASRPGARWITEKGDGLPTPAAASASRSTLDAGQRTARRCHPTGATATVSPSEIAVRAVHVMETGGLLRTA